MTRFVALTLFTLNTEVMIQLGLHWATNPAPLPVLTVKNEHRSSVSPLTLYLHWHSTCLLHWESLLIYTAVRDIGNKPGEGHFLPWFIPLTKGRSCAVLMQMYRVFLSSCGVLRLLTKERAEQKCTCTWSFLVVGMASEKALTSAQISDALEGVEDWVRKDSR